MAAVNNIDGVKMIELEYCAKSVNGNKIKSKKANFISYFYQQTVSPHYQVSEHRRNVITQMGKELHQILSTIASF